MAGPLAKKVSSRELRRALVAADQNVHAFTSAAATDLKGFQEQIQKTRELMADHGQKLDTHDQEIARTQGAIALFISQGWKGRLKWLLTGR